MIRMLLLLFSSAALLFAADVSGKWEGTWETIGRPEGLPTEACVLTLKQTGDGITGSTAPGPHLRWNVVNARLQGAKLTF